VFVVVAVMVAGVEPVVVLVFVLVWCPESGGWWRSR